MEKVIRQRNRSGKWIIKRVDMNAKIDTLDFLRREYHQSGQGIPFTTQGFLKKKNSSRFNRKTDAKDRARLNRLRKNGWVRKRRDGKLITSKKFSNFVRGWGTFLHPDSPLRKKKVETKILEKEITKEIKEIDRDKFLGER